MLTPEHIRLMRGAFLFLPLLVAPVAVEWGMRVSGLQARHLHAYDELAVRLSAGNTVIAGKDLRALKIATIRYRAPGSVLVLGSSRAMTITGNWFPSASVWNSAVDNGGLRESVAFYQATVEAGWSPDTVILELYPALSREPLPGTSHATDAARDRAVLRWGLPLPDTKFEFSWSDTARRLRSTLRELSPEAVQDESQFKVLPDGSVTLPAPTARAVGQNPGEATVDEKGVRAALRRLDPEQLQWRMRSVPDESRVRLLRSFLDELAARHIRLIVFLAPIHPIAWEYFAPRGGYNSRWIREELKHRNVKIVGDFSPLVTHADPADFTDAFHPRGTIVRRLLTEGGVIPPAATPGRAPTERSTQGRSASKVPGD